jgi:cobalamin biosynthesis protein CobT
MKKLFIFILAAMTAMVLAACGEETDESSEDATETEAVAEETANEEETEETASEEAEEDHGDSSEGETTENELGAFTMVNQTMDVDETHESGPMELTIHSIQSGNLVVSDEFKDMFDGKDELTMINVEMRAENTSEDNVSWYPDQAVMTTNAGDQVDADLLFSDSVGGEFFGPTNQEGSVLFMLDTPAEEIESVKLIINGPHNEDFETIGDDLEIELSF